MTRLTHWIPGEVSPLPRMQVGVSPLRLLSLAAERCAVSLVATRSHLQAFFPFCDPGFSPWQLPGSFPTTPVRTISCIRTRWHPHCPKGTPTGVFLLLHISSRPPALRHLTANRPVHHDSPVSRTFPGSTLAVLPRTATSSPRKHHPQSFLFREQAAKGRAGGRVHNLNYGSSLHFTLGSFHCSRRGANQEKPSLSPNNAHGTFRECTGSPAPHQEMAALQKAAAPLPHLRWRAPPSASGASRSRPTLTQTSSHPHPDLQLCSMYRSRMRGP